MQEKRAEALTACASALEGDAVRKFNSKHYCEEGNTMENMKAVRIHQYGGPDELKIEDVQIALVLGEEITNDRVEFPGKQA